MIAFAPGDALRVNVHCPLPKCGWQQDVTSPLLLPRWNVVRHECGRKRCGAHMLAGYYIRHTAHGPEVTTVGPVVPAGAAGGPHFLRSERSWLRALRDLQRLTLCLPDPMTDDDVELYRVALRAMSQAKPAGGGG